MTSDSSRAKFDEILSQHLPVLDSVQPIVDELRTVEYGLDSIRRLKLLAALESGFEVRFRPEDLTDSSFSTAGSLWRTVVGLRATTLAE
ncbi:phosphopantetheine-binding protein [Amycolatopsis sp. cmx-11-12]|uniref:phosphopantetheine-binding protein n=1 Tax=Amycolatopsis sp. cmx-11-12 TaxID=2785795 RepID=UPI003917C187